MLLSVDDFGCVPDGRYLSHVSIQAGSAQLSAPGGALRQADVGKHIAIPGAVDLVATVSGLLARKDVASASMEAGGCTLTAVLTGADGFFQARVHEGLRITVAGAGPQGASLVSDVSKVIERDDARTRRGGGERRQPGRRPSGPGCIRRSPTCSPRGCPALLRHHLHPLLARRTPISRWPATRGRVLGAEAAGTPGTQRPPRPIQGSATDRAQPRDRTLSRVRPDHGNALHQSRRTRDGSLDGRPVPAAARRTARGTDPPSCIARRASTVISPTARVRIGLVALMLVAAGCGSKGSNESSEGAGGGQSGTLTLGASLSLTGSLAREGQLTKEGYELCKQSVNAKGGVDLGGRKVRLDIKYQDDASQPDTAA